MDLLDEKYFTTFTDGLYIGVLNNTEERYTSSMNQIGVMMYNNGNIYIGKWIQDQKYREGIMIYTNGDIYVGNWYKNKKHGTGYILDLDGNVIKGKWKNDEKIN